MRFLGSHVGLILAGMLGLASVASAEPARKTAALSWVRAPGAEACPALATVTAAVEARLRRSAFVNARNADVLIEATIAKRSENARFSVRITLSNRADALLGTRDLETPDEDCRAATDSAALAIALMIDPEAATADVTQGAPEPPVTSPTIAPGTAAPTSEPTSVPCVAATPSPAPEREPTHWRARLGLSGLVVWGQLPGTAPGLLGSVRLVPPSGLVGIEGAGRYLPEKDVEARPGAGGSVGASSASLGGFWVPLRKQRVAVSLAAAAEVGQLRARGYNFAAKNLYSREWLVNADVSGELAFQVAEPVAALLRLGLKVPLVRAEFTALVDSKSETIFKTSPVIGEVSLGLAFAP